MNADRMTTRNHRRGNTIVLVTGILVLLVIIATAFVVRTGAGRVTATSVVNSSQRDDNSHVIAESVAQELSIALFARPVNVAVATTDPAVQNIFGGNWPRYAIPANGLRLFPDMQDTDGNGRLDFPYNTPPFEVVARTNWPDPNTPNANDGISNFAGLTANFWPGGLGNPGVTHLAPSPLAGEFNDLGNPGFGDTRWLRDLEPLRWDPDGDGILDSFSHWRHMTNIARPDNGWRIVSDVADVGDIDPAFGLGALVTDLNVPVEQWLSLPHAYRNTVSGNSYVPADFFPQWDNWFSFAGYQAAYANSAVGANVIPPNFYKLNDLDGDGVASNFFIGTVPQDLPQSEFIFGTARNVVGRVLADADGDGFTDSFWFLAPAPVQSGIRTVVAVSVVDNQGMFNLNVGTRFTRNNTTGLDIKTAGLTPTDLAIVGQQIAPINGNFNVGFFDLWEQWLFLSGTQQVPPWPTTISPAYIAQNPVDTRYTVDPSLLWSRHLSQVGLTNAAGNPIVSPTVAARLDYWRRSASSPLSPPPFSPYTPFGLSDEIELRMYAGQNYPWSASRLEFSAESNITLGGTTSFGPFHASLGREESSEFQRQLPNAALVMDQRHRTTVYNGARNDIMPPWLWLWGPHRDFNNNDYTTAGGLDLNNDGAVNAADEALFLAGSRKFDLRIPYDSGSGFITLPGEWDGLPGFEYTPNTSALQVGIALRDRISAALLDGFDNLPNNRGTYYGNNPNDVDRTLELAAAYAANIAQVRDRVSTAATDLTSRETAPLEECVPIAATATNPTPTDRFMGLEPQPFLVEVFIGHVYQAIGPIPAVDAAGNPYNNAGQHVVVEEQSRRSTIIAVQIANPFRRPINLDDANAQFQVRVFGQEFDLASMVPNGILPPATDDQPATLILYALRSDLNGDLTFPAEWVDFLDINHSTNPVVVPGLTSLTANSIVVRVPTTRWGVESRTVYDDETTSAPAVDIRRRDMNQTTGVIGPWVTIDRIDSPGDERFKQAVTDLEATRPEDYPGELPANYTIPNPDPIAGNPYPGHMIGIDGSNYDHWVQWARATRAWGVDVDSDGEADSNERSPRYVFGDYAVGVADGTAAVITDPNDPNTFVYLGDRYRGTTDPDTPWFTRPYKRENPASLGTDETVATRKPTFFDLNHGEGIPGGPPPLPPPAGLADPVWPQWSFPNKGWYGQIADTATTGSNYGGSPDDPVIQPPVPPQTQGDRGYRYPYAFQMLHKDGDFEQVGELLNVFLYGHRLQFSAPGPGGLYVATTTTFSEYMSEASGALTGYQDPDQRFRTNRLLLSPVNTGSGNAGAVVGVGDPAALDDPRHAIPDLPAGVRLLEGFVCDSYGVEPFIDTNNNGLIDPAESLAQSEQRTFYNAKGFDGSATPGLININTAPLEVIRTLPHMFRLVHETGGISAANPFYTNAGQPLVTTAPLPDAVLPRVFVPESMQQYREKSNGNTTAGGTGIPGGPDFEARQNPRGFATIGEPLLLQQDGQSQVVPPLFNATFFDRQTSNTTDHVYNPQWRMDMGTVGLPIAVGAALPPKPFLDLPSGAVDQMSMRISTDRQAEWDPFAVVAGTPRPDSIAGDAEEANMLFAGISNLITTRSDVFTVYLKVRTFRQNTSVNPPRWDATNREYIIDDSRYVMLVDRSGVNSPSDKPRILYFEKLPN